MSKETKKELNKRLRDMSGNSKFTNEDREEVLKELKKLDSGKLDLRKLVEQKLEDKKMSNLIGENSGRLSEKERKIVSGALTMANKIPGIGAMIGAGKTFRAIKNAIDKVGKTKNKSGPDLTKRAKGGMINKYAKGGEVKKYMGGGSVHKNKNKMLTTKGWGASRKT